MKVTKRKMERPNVSHYVEVRAVTGTTEVLLEGGGTALVVYSGAPRAARRYAKCLIDILRRVRNGSL